MSRRSVEFGQDSRYPWYYPTAFHVGKPHVRPDNGWELRALKYTGVFESWARGTVGLDVLRPHEGVRMQHVYYSEEVKLLGSGSHRRGIERIMEAALELPDEELWNYGNVRPLQAALAALRG